MGRHVRIENISSAGLQTVALGGSISTQQGTASDLFDKKMSTDNETNIDLIKKVTKSGHMSVLEHMTFSILFTDVSVCIEEFFIEHRLASFTVKSRRYVDFSNAGFYVPDECKGTDGNPSIYEKDMRNLFETYEKLVGMGIPKEDARFILPYSFHDNFVCTLNAREAIHIVEDLYAMGVQQAKMACYELEDCGSEYLQIYLELMGELREKIPVIHDIIAEKHHKIPDIIGPKYIDEEIPSDVAFIAYTDTMDNLYNICNHTSTRRVTNRGTVEVHPQTTTDCALRIANIDPNVFDNPRILEFLNYYIKIQDISLSTLTHLVRHRMQSIIVPRLDTVECNRFIVPRTIIDNDGACTLYLKAIDSHIAAFSKLDGHVVKLPWVRQYMLLSGNAINVETCMNARELMTFMKLRTCNRAQWEIKYFADEILKKLRSHEPRIFRYYGPSCYVGHCPEGKLSCGRANEMIEKYTI